MTESWLGAPKTANSDGRGWGGGVRVRECERACVRDVFALYDNDILPILIMIICNIIILYFIQIRHIGDFPSTGTGLVIHNVFTGVTFCSQFMKARGQ